jgi:hypothetical protein
MKPPSPIRLLAVMACALAMAGTGAVEARQESQPSGASTCIAIVLPSVTGAAGNATDLGTAVRDLFVSYLTGPTINAIALESRLPSQAVLEAQQKGCGHVVIPSVVRKRKEGSKLGRALGGAAGTAAWHMPYGGSAGAAAARAGAAAAAHTAANMAADTRAKDELELSYRVGTPDNVTQAKAVTSKAKARNDGEDLLTPLVERAAEQIATAATR